MTTRNIIGRRGETDNPYWMFPSLTWTLLSLFFFCLLIYSVFSRLGGAMGMERKKLLLLASLCFIFSLYLFISGGTYYWNGYSSPVLPISCESYKGTCAFGSSLNVASFPLPLFFPSDTVDLVCLSSIMTLCDNFTTISCVIQDSNFGRRSNESYKKSLKLKCLIALLLLMSGNVQPTQAQTPL